LLLVGQYEEGDAVGDATRAAIADHPRIVTVPWVDDTAAVYRAMDVLAFPSHREGLPNVPLEAQLCGVPVVAYAATGTVDAVADGVGGVLVERSDRDAFAQALRALLDDPARRDAMGAAGTAWVTQRFAQDLVWQTLRDLLEQAR
jgi:glycosyltransferase involved in cell wall biosynthesis